MQIKKSNSAFVLILSVTLVLFLGILLSAALLRTQMQLQESDQRLDSQRAFYAAETGIERSLFEIRQNPQWRSTAPGQPAMSYSGNF